MICVFRTKADLYSSIYKGAVIKVIISGIKVGLCCMFFSKFVSGKICI